MGLAAPKTPKKQRRRQPRSAGEATQHSKAKRRHPATARRSCAIDRQFAADRQLFAPTAGTRRWGWFHCRCTRPRQLATGRSMCLRLPELRARARMAATPRLGNREKSPGKTTREADRKIISGSSWGLRMRRPPSAAAHAERARGKCLAPAERDDLHRAPFRAHGQIV
jgi:hypothetical protein